MRAQVVADWNTKFENWGQPPSQSEKIRCENAISTIKKAIAKCEAFKGRDVKVFLQGSYQNNVNVRQSSDVDIGVCCNDSLFYDLPAGMSMENFGLEPAQYTSANFRNDVRSALIQHFGVGEVIEGKKAFDIKSNTYRVAADVAPFFVYKRYDKGGGAIEGVRLVDDMGGGSVINWPEQHHDNGVEKNKATGYKYKQLVRVLKKLSLEMESKGLESAKVIPGFLCECLMWNVPDERITGLSLYDGLWASIDFLWNAINEGKHVEWGEVSDLNYLFHSGQKWTDVQAKDFLVDVYRFVGYE